MQYGIDVRIVVGQKKADTPVYSFIFRSRVSLLVKKTLGFLKAIEQFVIDQQLKLAIFECSCVLLAQRYSMKELYVYRSVEII